jgi:nicotinamide riboside transporter PnuC
MVDWIAAFVGFWGTWQLRKKNKNGFLWLTVMSILWLIVGLQMGTYGLALSSFVFIFLNLLGYWEWRKEEKEKSDKEK